MLLKRQSEAVSRELVTDKQNWRQSEVDDGESAKWVDLVKRDGWAEQTPVGKCVH